jgi:Tol biopolymer transport system component
MNRRNVLARPLMGFLVFLAFAFLASANAKDDHLAVADLLELERVSDARISPDGSQIIYTRRWVDQHADRWGSALWIMEADGSKNRFLIKGSNARWSRTGDRILFLAAGGNDKPQIFVRWMDDEGAVSQVTRVNVTPSSPQWSPDGKQIAFVAIVPAEDSWNIKLPKGPKGAEWSKPPRILDRLHYRQDRIGFTDPGFSHLFVVPADSGTARQLTEGEWNVGAQFDGMRFGAGISWMPDSKSIVFDGLNDPEGDFAYNRSNIYSIDIGTREITQLGDVEGYWSAPRVSHDGKNIAYTGYPTSEITYEMPRVYVMASDGSNARLITENFDRPPNGLFWAARDRGIYFTAQDEGYINVFHTDLKGKVRAVTSGHRTLALNSLDAKMNLGVGVGIQGVF